MDYMNHIDKNSDIAQIVQGFEIFEILISNEEDRKRFFSQFREKKLSWDYSNLGAEEEWGIEYYKGLIAKNISDDYSYLQCELNIVIPLQLLKTQLSNAQEHIDDVSLRLDRIKCFWEALNQTSFILASSYYSHVMQKVKIVYLDILIQAGVRF